MIKENNNIRVHDADGNVLDLHMLAEIFNRAWVTMYTWNVKYGCTTLKDYVLRMDQIQKGKCRSNSSVKTYETYFGTLTCRQVADLAEITYGTAYSRIQSYGAGSLAIFFDQDKEAFKRQCTIHNIITRQELAGLEQRGKHKRRFNKGRKDVRDLKPIGTWERENL